MNLWGLGENWMIFSVTLPALTNLPLLYLQQGHTCFTALVYK